MLPASARLDVAIIGAGLSGTLTAIQLSRLAPDLSIGLIEGTRAPGQGLAYSTPDETHLLNVRADRMSAFPSEPDGFTRWLAGEDTSSVYRVETGAGEFVSRRAYGRYLQDLLAAAQAASAGRVTHVPARVQAVSAGKDGYQIATSSGQLHAKTVVLAMGNLAAPFALPDGSLAVNPWGADAFDGLAADAPVAVIGTGLTMIDVVTALRRRGHTGPVTAISRRGLVPQAHGGMGALPNAAALGLATGTLSQRLKRLRQAARVHGWREVMDCLRPVTQALWQGFSLTEKQRFLRHARPWWDIHRHRIAAPVSEMLEQERAAGRLVVLAGRLASGGQGILVVRRRNCGDDAVLHPARIFDAAGFGPLRQSRDPLIMHLMQSGLAREDETGLGLAADRALAVKGSDGRSQGLYAIGPLVRGEFWECTAVPDIRVQAEALATHISAISR